MIVNRPIDSGCPCPACSRSTNLDGSGAGGRPIVPRCSPRARSAMWVSRVAFIVARRLDRHATAAELNRGGLHGSALGPPTPTASAKNRTVRRRFMTNMPHKWSCSTGARASRRDRGGLRPRQPCDMTPGLVNNRIVVKLRMEPRAAHRRLTTKANDKLHASTPRHRAPMAIRTRCRTS